MGFIKGKNLSQQFPSPTQRTKKTNFSTTFDKYPLSFFNYYNNRRYYCLTSINKMYKYTYVCIPDAENKWFEHRWKIENESGGSYYLCVDVPGPGVKRKVHY